MPQTLYVFRTQQKMQPVEQLDKFGDEKPVVIVMNTGK
jgi:hypothetical protein